MGRCLALLAFVFGIFFDELCITVSSMKKIFFIPVFCLLFFTQGYATHNRAGEITYEVLNCATRTYRVTITTYTNYCPTCNPVPPDRQSLDSVHWGDGQMATFPRVFVLDSIELGKNIRI